MIDRKLLYGASAAAVAILLIPGVAAALARTARPLFKAAVKTGATAYDEFSRACAEAYEHVEDVVAEVRSEMADNFNVDADEAGSGVVKSRKRARGTDKRT